MKAQCHIIQKCITSQHRKVKYLQRQKVKQSTGLLIIDLSIYFPLDVWTLTSTLLKPQLSRCRRNPFILILWLQESTFNICGVILIDSTTISQVLFQKGLSLANKTNREQDRIPNLELLPGQTLRYNLEHYHRKKASSCDHFRLLFTDSFSEAFQELGMIQQCHGVTLFYVTNQQE